MHLIAPQRRSSFHPLGHATMALILAVPVADAAVTLTDEDLLLSRSPVIIRSRLSAGGDFTDLGGGGHRGKMKFGGAYGFGFNGRDRNFGVGLEVPYLWDRPDASAGQSGMGDLKVRAGQLFAWVPDAWRAGWFFETEFDTAASDVSAIANQRTQMALGGGAVIPIHDRLAVASSLAYGWSLDEGATTGRKAEWEAHLTATWKVAGRVSASLDYKSVLHTVGGTEYLHALEPGVGVTWGSDASFGLNGSLEVPLDETGVDWIAKLGLIRFF